MRRQESKVTINDFVASVVLTTESDVSAVITMPHCFGVMETSVCEHIADIVAGFSIKGLPHQSKVGGNLFAI